jgi:starch synthase
MRVVFAASEVTPYASTGGLADVADALPGALAARGVEIVRVMPCYRQVMESGYRLKDTGIRLPIHVGLHTYTAEVYITADEHAPVTYFIRRDEFFDRSELYSLPYRDYEDNFERFVFFQKAVVSLIDLLSYQPDIVHCNDWQTGLIPLYLQYGIGGVGRVRTEKSVFTIHNLAYQGLFPAGAFSLTNLPFSCFSLEVLEFYGKVNCLKAGITSADALTTVSPEYAREIQTDTLGCGLEGVIRLRADQLRGIINGVDYNKWNPQTDTLLPHTFSSSDLKGKSACREELIRRTGLHVGDKTAVLGMISRLTEQKGLDILSECMDDIMAEDVVVVILGTGSEIYQDLCAEWSRKWEDRFAFIMAYDTEMAHLIEGGADLYLMPSRFEPCGLNQLYSLRYGTPPIVHETGGLKDTITLVSEDAEAGNGFPFSPYHHTAMLDALKRALALFAQPAKWRQLQQRIMQEDFSWDRSAREYIELYESIC